jgi:SPP1 gp7 family putative phage head morphogenesis protein
MPDLWTQKYRFQHRLIGVINGIDEEIAKILEGALEKVTAKIASLAIKAEETESLTRKRKYLEKQRLEIQKVLNEIYQDKIGGAIETKATELAQATPGIMSDMVKDTIGIELSTPHLDKKTIKAWYESSQVEGLSPKRWLTKLSDNAVNRIVAETRESLILHESLSQTSKRIQKALDIGRRSAEGISHNAVHGAFNFAEREMYLENQDIIENVRFSAVIDRKTTDICISLDGEEFPIKSAPLPPLHFRCRSMLMPIFKGIKFEGKRVARLDTGSRKIHHLDGTTSTVYDKRRVQFIPESMNHNQWTQSLVNSSDPRDVSFAREMLGPTRFNLVKAGKFEVKDLYYHGKLRTIKELKGLI